MTISGAKTLADIHGYWFDGIRDEDKILKKQQPFVKWFRSTRALDEEMRELFGHLFDQSHPITHDSSTHQELLCAILLYDQLSRNIFRRTNKAYAFDCLARDIALQLIKEKKDKGFSYIERSFLYMPLTHSENESDQEASVCHTEDLFKEASNLYPQNTAYFESNLTYARQYRDIIQKYGRFPHRNVILERDSTQEEKEFLCGR